MLKRLDEIADNLNALVGSEGLPVITTKMEVSLEEWEALKKDFPEMDKPRMYPGETKPSTPFFHGGVALFYKGIIFEVTYNPMI